MRRTCSWLVALLCANLMAVAAIGAESTASPVRAYVDPGELGWKALGEEDFQNVNCDPDTWKWKDGALSCTGTPVGVTRSRKEYTNFELSLRWKHTQPGGNSGVFVWAPLGPLEALKRDQLPQGIEIQVLDHAFKTQYEKSSGKKADWFTTNGDVFPVRSTMKPFPPVSPNGERSFPRKELSKGVNEWNHYYIRAINGEVRLWVNGEEVAGGNDCDPRTGYICLESEGAPLEFADIRIRELP